MVVVAGLLLFAELPLLIPAPFPLTDHLVFWKAGQLVVSGGSPFDMAAWAEAQRTYASEHLQLFIEHGSAVWVYPAWTAFLFAPFGLLPYPSGPWALYLAYLAVGLFATVLFIRSLTSRWRRPAELALIIAAAFQPLLIADRYGQFGAFLLLGTVLIFIGLRDRRTLPLSVGALLVFAKPQLFTVLAPVVLVILVRRRAWRTVVIVAGIVVAVAVATTLRYPESLAFSARGAADRAAAFTMYSSTWAFAHYLSGDSWPITGGALIGLSVIASVVAVRRLPSDVRLAGTVAAAAAVSLMITPVAFSYDQVTLLLTVVLAVAVGRRLSQIAATWVVALVIPWFLFFIGIGTERPDAQSLSGAVPLLMAPLLLFVTTWSSPVTQRIADEIDEHPSQQRQQAEERQDEVRIELTDQTRADGTPDDDPPSGP